MKKLLLFGIVLGAALPAMPQAITETAVVLDQTEDTTRVTTIKDIIVTQEMVNSRNTTDAHLSNVWKRKSYFNPGFVFSKLSTRENVPLNNNENAAFSFKSDWGAQVELGHSYTLHRGALANMVQINLDFTYIDLTVNHYKSDKSILEKYKSTDKWGGNSSSSYQNGYDYLPWGADKYDATYGMSLGPSITIAPFIPLNIRGLHFIKFNAYYHIGYNVGVLLLDQKRPNRNSSTSVNTKDSNSLSFDYLNWGHGLSTSFGVSVSWKSFGIGWETRSANLNYKPASTAEYGNSQYKLKNASNRVYLSIRY